MCMHTCMLGGKNPACQRVHAAAGGHAAAISRNCDQTPPLNNSGLSQQIARRILRKFSSVILSVLLSCSQCIIAAWVYRRSCDITSVGNTRSFLWCEGLRLIIFLSVRVCLAGLEGLLAHTRGTRSSSSGIKSCQLAEHTALSVTRPSAELLVVRSTLANAAGWLTAVFACSARYGCRTSWECTKAANIQQRGA